jgi:FKBP-type peptidyl-prolyl cis-trans isomerase FklB
MRRNQRVLESVATVTLSLLLAPSLLALAGIAEDRKAGPTELKTDQEKKSYAVGMSVGNQVKARAVKVDPDLVVRGLEDSLSGHETLLSEAQAGEEMRALQQDVKQRKGALRREAIEKNEREGAAFLSANKAKEGVITLGSGLQYKILKPGSGKNPAANDIIICNYRGTLIDGTEFDSSYKRGRPAAFALSRVMQAWKEALPLMPVGTKLQLFVPPELAYGAHGAGNVIGPNATLIFDLELLGIRGVAGQKRAQESEMAAGSQVGIVERKAGIAPPAAAPAVVPLGDIRVSFKLDPLLSGATYGGEHWIASPTFTSGMQVGKEATVEAKAEGIAGSGAPVAATMEWNPADAGMVTVVPGESNQVKITVHRAGQSKVTVSSNGVAKQLLIKAKYVGNATQLEITRPAVQKNE